ncbi:hypothetical protein [Streptomyces sp. SID3343]|uniref:hypothetical protein n=1 Tax=Streptomyces sp. SID3343 TaxID=2690260 RepID=UPI0013705D79|nr:hypothetical protein [Streptomyces sp. SID3343]MYV99543.1 hypothetical protein [Streptomyces sp. SID3343]
MSSYPRKSWSSIVVSPVLGALTAAFLVAGLVVTVVFGLGSGIGLLAAAPLTGLFTIIRVRTDEIGLTVEFGLLPWVRKRIPIAKIREAGHRDVRAFRDFGGWGYRIRAGASGVVQRSGDALAVRLDSGREFVVTVDNARTGAAVLNGLLTSRD